MQKFGTSLSRFGFAINNKTENLEQISSTQLKSESNKFYDNNVKSFDSDNKQNGTGLSSWVSTIDYDSSLFELKITFKDGTTCSYKDITPDIVEDFNKAPSKGRWVRDNLVANNHEYKVIRVGHSNNDSDFNSKNKSAQSNGMKTIK